MTVNSFDISESLRLNPLDPGRVWHAPLFSKKQLAGLGGFHG